MTLGFLEPTATAAAARVFDVTANGVARLTNFDVFAIAGARNTAIARSFPVTVSNGVLALDFAGVMGKAIVSNIMVVKQ